MALALMFFQTVSPLQNPGSLDDRDQADESRVGLRQAPEDRRGLWRLDRIVLNQIPNQNVRIEAGHRRPRRGAASVAPRAIASFISSMETGRLRARIMPRSAETGSFGKSTTLPSGWTKNLMRVGRAYPPEPGSCVE